MGSARRPTAVVYTRVSTDAQAERGLGLDVQERACREWAREHGYRIVAICTDAGEPGSNGLDTRDGLADGLALLRAGDAEALIVYRLDRLARDLVLQEQLLAEAWSTGAEVCSTAGGEGNLADDPDDPSRRLIRQILGAVSEYERAMIALRMRRGRRRKAEAGGFAYGAPPFGTRAEDGALTVEQREQQTIARARQLRAEGASLRTIAATLDAEGLPPRRGDRWHPQTIARVLRR